MLSATLRREKKQIRFLEDKAFHSLLYYHYTNYSGIFIPCLFKKHGKLRKKLQYSILPLTPFLLRRLLKALS